eukprot:3306322-Prymnesium_polylepis.1
MAFSISARSFWRAAFAASQSRWCVFSFERAFCERASPKSRVIFSSSASESHLTPASFMRIASAELPGSINCGIRAVDTSARDRSLALVALLAAALGAAGFGAPLSSCSSCSTRRSDL